MADEIDQANDRAMMETERAIAATRRPLQEGTQGECQLCGEWSGRLIGEACAPCRDKYQLP